MSENTELNPCPFCGSNAEPPWNNSSINPKVNHWMISCGACGACSPYGHSVDDVTEKWNKRAKVGGSIAKLVVSLAANTEQFEKDMEEAAEIARRFQEEFADLIKLNVNIAGGSLTNQ